MNNFKIKKLNTKSTKMGKELIKSLNEAVKDVKASKPAVVKNCSKGKFISGEKSYNTVEEMLADWKKEERARWNKLTPAQKAKEKARNKVKIEREKIQEQKREEKYAKQRASKGYCDRDVWSIDWWMHDLMPKMLRELANNMHGWQPRLGYTYCSKTKSIIKTKKEITFKEHQKVILKLADMIDKMIIEDATDKNWNNRKLGYLGGYNEKLKDKAMKIFSDILFSLWD